MPKFTLVLTIVFVPVLLISYNVHAGTFKCKDKDGGITYSQVACPKHETTDKVMNKKNNQISSSSNCVHVRMFAKDTADFMKNGADSDEVINHYGGVNSISAGAMIIINHVYGYRLNNDISAKRIGELAQTKCEANSFGQIGCEDIPTSYAELMWGGCDDVNGNVEYSRIKVIAGEREKLRYQTSTQREEALESLEIQRQKENKERAKRIEKKIASQAAMDSMQCKDYYENKIDHVNKQMREGYSSEQGEIYREKLRHLRNQRNQC